MVKITGKISKNQADMSTVSSGKNLDSLLGWPIPGPGLSPTCSESLSSGVEWLSSVGGKDLRFTLIFPCTCVRGATFREPDKSVPDLISPGGGLGRSGVSLSDLTLGGLGTAAVTAVPADTRLSGEPKGILVAAPKVFCWEASELVETGVIDDARTFDIFSFAVKPLACTKALDLT